MTTQHNTVIEHTAVHTPESLFNTCVKYVAGNMGLVESLDGIPEIIGEHLFKSCVESEMFLHNDSETHYCIRLFAEAYGSEFMESFKCTSPLFFNEYCESLTMMCVSVTHLDVSGCQLGNNNDFLRALVNMKDLKVLNISKNELSQDGFRLLLARYRMFQEGFQSLVCLDVSENIVDLKTLNTLLRMSKLKNIRVSIASSLKIKIPKFIQEWTASIKKYKFRIMSLGEVIPSSVVTKGLGAQIVNVWERKTDEWEAARLMKIDKRNKGFYAPLLKQSQNDVFKSKTNSDKFDTYSYVRDSELLAEEMNEGVSNVKRKFDLVQGSNGDMSTAIKKKKEYDLNLDLLEMYRS